MSEPLRIVLDTNLLVASIGTASPFRWIFDAVLDGQVTLLVSTAILHEYREVIERKTRPDIAENVLRALLLLPNVIRCEPSFRWDLIPEDPDDNKFVDAAIACGASALVTHDRHFRVLHDLDFPPITVWRAEHLNDALT